VAVGLVLVATRRGLTQGAEAGVDRGGRKIFGVREGELEEVVREGDIGGGGRGGGGGEAGPSGCGNKARHGSTLTISRP